MLRDWKWVRKILYRYIFKSINLVDSTPSSSSLFLFLLKHVQPNIPKSIDDHSIKAVETSVPRLCFCYVDNVRFVGQEHHRFLSSAVHLQSLSLCNDGFIKLTAEMWHLNISIAWPIRPLKVWSIWILVNLSVINRQDQSWFEVFGSNRQDEKLAFPKPLKLRHQWDSPDLDGPALWTSL